MKVKVKSNMDSQINIEQFLTQFFTANHCEVETIEPGMLAVQLTVEMDKALMNRPFYWQYIEATGNVGQPKKLTFLLDPEKMDQDGEWIHFGSPRLQKIYRHLTESAKFVHLFEELDVKQNTMLHPWLLTNYTIVYEGKQKKEELFSIGLNLINGKFAFDMMENLEETNLMPTISDHCYTISPLIKPKSGFLRIENHLHNYVLGQKHDWAAKSIKLLEEEIAMIRHFYSDDDEEAEQQMEKELDDIRARLKPHISYKVVSGGIIYLNEAF